MPRTETDFRLRAEEFRVARGDGVWSKLAGYNAPETAAILCHEFPDSQETFVLASRLHERVSDDIRVLTRLGRKFENTGQGYCSIWVTEGWLERRPNAAGTEEVYELTADGLAAIDAILRIVSPTVQTTESKMMAVMGAVERLALVTDPDTESRIAYHRQQIAEHEAEIARLEAEHAEPIDDASALEGVRDLLSQVAHSSTDFARVRRQRTDTINNLRRQALDSDGTRGDVLESIIAQLERSSSSEAGRSFDAFYQVISDPVQVARVEAAIADILARPFAFQLAPVERIALRDMLTDLRQRASDVHRVTDALAAKLRAYIEENRFAQERRVGALLTDVMRTYAKLAEHTPGSASVPFELELSNSELGSVTRWQLPQVDRTLPAPVEDHTDSSDVSWEELAYLVEDTDIDFHVLRANIDDTLDAQNGLATIQDMVRRTPLVSELADLIGYVIIGFHGVDGGLPAASVLDGKSESIPWADGRTAIVPKILFRNQEHV
jgi:hypothetical protein